jgi:hypothetical protein
MVSREVPIALSEGESVSADTGIEELDLEGPIRDRRLGYGGSERCRMPASDLGLVPLESQQFHRVAETNPFL